MDGSDNMSGQQKCYARWNDAFPGTIPLGWHVRKVHRSRWLRLYALPNGKRCPETESEVTEIIRRFRHVIEALGGNWHDDVCLLVPVREGAPRNGRYGLGKILDAGFECVLRSCSTPDEDDETFNIYAILTQLKDPTVSQILRLIQDDEFMQSIFLLENGNLVAPYDGGFDVIVNEPPDLENIRCGFSEWLSPRPDGL